MTQKFKTAEFHTHIRYCVPTVLTPAYIQVAKRVSTSTVTSVQLQLFNTIQTNIIRFLIADSTIIFFSLQTLTLNL